MRRGGGARYLPEGDVRQRALTPAEVLEPIRELLGGIALDPCTEPSNPTRAERFYCRPADGCALSWEARNVYCNPPYGRARTRWVERCMVEGDRRAVVLLMPAHTEVDLFQRALASFASVVLLAGRIRFPLVRKNGRRETASHGSALFGSIDLSPLASLGRVLQC